jgi:glutamate 5-kinase
VLPVINENDTSSTTRSSSATTTPWALVANLVEADALVILTDQRPVPPTRARTPTPASSRAPRRPGAGAMAGGAGSSIGRGGMITKILAAKRAAGSGAGTVIAWGAEPDVLLRLARARPSARRCTRPRRAAARKQWMADHLQLRGAVRVDAGAAKLRDEGKSLLPIGVTEVEGDFQRGDVIAVQAGRPSGAAWPTTQRRGAPDRAQAVVGVRGLLGYAASPKLIHRDNLVLR